MDGLAEKQLTDGTKLKLQTYVSGFIGPVGARMYKLKLVEHRGVWDWPTYDDYSETEVREFYDSIDSKKDFLRIRGEHTE